MHYTASGRGPAGGGHPAGGVVDVVGGQAEPGELLAAQLRLLGRLDVHLDLDGDVGVLPLNLATVDTGRRDRGTIQS